MKMIKQLIGAACITGSASFAADNNSTSLTYESLDMTLSAGGVSVSGDASGVSSSIIFALPDSRIGFIGSYANAYGTIGKATLDMNGFSVGVGYELVDTLDRSAGTGSEILVGLSYSSASGSVNISGTSYSVDDNDTSFIGRVEGRVSETVSLLANVNASLEGDGDPTFGVSVAYDITENGALSVGYSSNKSTTNGVTMEISGWSIGWVSNF